MANRLNDMINRMRLKRIDKLLSEVNRYSQLFATYSDEALQAKTIEFKQRLKDPKISLNQLLPKPMLRYVRHLNECYICIQKTYKSWAL